MLSDSYHRIVAGLLVVFGVWLCDHALHVDDPVGAVAVHGVNGIWGTIAVGLFSTTTVPGNDTLNGLFYGGGIHPLLTQLLGFATIPMIAEPKASTVSQGAVMATRPASEALRHIDTSGLPYLMRMAK